MQKKEYLFTPGNLFADGDNIVSDVGVVVATASGCGRYLQDLKERQYERICNARLFAEAKNMLEIIESVAEMPGSSFLDNKSRSIEIIKRIRGEK